MTEDGAENREDVLDMSSGASAATSAAAATAAELLPDGVGE